MNESQSQLTLSVYLLVIIIVLSLVLLVLVLYPKFYHKLFENELLFLLLLTSFVF